MRTWALEMIKVCVIGMQCVAEWHLQKGRELAIDASSYYQQGQ